MAEPKETTAKRSKKKPEIDEGTIQDLISKKAYELYEESGMDHGRDTEHWLEAEKIIRGNGLKKNKKGSK
ncbi:MAG: DUF2934 domain-containing protein [Thermodesulfobacteriota bacterium]